ncbi:hypothetical protein N9L49_03865 [Rhodospirillales bacterium]|nr:hypothetical protein [Rhodospirillales bacterium]
MLEQKLAEASQAAHKRRLKTALIFFGAAAFIALFLVGFIRLDLGVLGVQSNSSSETASTPDQQSSSEQHSGNASTSVDQAASSVTPNIETNGTGQILPAPLPTDDQLNDSSATAQNPADRETFKKALTAFDQDVRPLIESDGFKAWDNAAVIDILEKREEATSAFSVGDYTSALSRLQSGTDSAADKLDNYEAAFDTAFQDADIAYQSEDVETAQLKITEALRLKPNSAAAQQLKTQIDRLPKVLSLINEAVTARVENDLQREAKFLKEIIELDPTREDQKNRLATVNTTISESRFASYISNGMAGVERRDLKTAETNLRKAEALFKSRDAVTLLSSQVATLKRELNAEALVEKGIAASAADDWDQAAAYFVGARKVLPDNKEALDGHLLASKIIDLKKQTAKHLSNPARLSNQSVMTTVEALIEDTKVFGDFSPSLKARSQELAAFLIVYSTPVEVTVVSDGVTQVSVRGIGQVGRTTGRTINLKPGTYSFEGKRPGYVSTLIKVDIAPGAEGITVEVICDEPI